MFIGREKELQVLERLHDRPSAAFAVIRGRRRIGKSRLITEFSKSFKKKYLLTGIPPTPGVTDQDQRDEFMRQLVAQGLPDVKTDDWGNIFHMLAQACEGGHAIIALDEIAWMGSKDPTFLGKLKIAWDIYFEKNPKLVLVVASSISSWIEENILSSTGFFGRIDTTLTLDELPIQHCCEFWKKSKGRVSDYEKLIVLGVTGGVPKYLNAINPNLSAEDNIHELCFEPSGQLFNEFDKIFHDLFAKRSRTYKSIVELLASHSSLTQDEICKGISQSNGRQMSEYLLDLTTAGFLSADYTWHLRSGKISKLRKYRLRDNYLRFYLKYVLPHKQKILLGEFNDSALSHSIQWETIMGLQFENLVIYNRKTIYRALNIRAGHVLMSGPFFQTKTQKQKGCQIDFLIQDRSNTIFICEIKFSKNPIGKSVIDQVQSKIDALTLPSRTSYRPVLIHVNGVTPEVIGEEFFHEIIDWKECMHTK